MALRNDLAGGAHRVMWTGNIDKVWPPSAPGGPGEAYAGGENGDTIAHIEYAALLILKSRGLWTAKIPDGDPHGYGATYLQRAKTYVARCEEANDEYSAKYFVQPGTNLIRNPGNWPAGFHTMEAINIQMMLDGGFQRDAEIHELLGDAPARVARYDAIVKASVRECLNGMKHPSTVNGHTVYTWYYYPWDVRHLESVGHAAYDILGIWRASNAQGLRAGAGGAGAAGRHALFVISKGGGMFATSVDGSGALRGSVQDEWLLTSEWNDSVYDLMAGPALASRRFARTPMTTAAILFMKGRRAGPAQDGGAGEPDARGPSTHARRSTRGRPPPGRQSMRARPIPRRRAATGPSRTRR